MARTRTHRPAGKTASLFPVTVFLGAFLLFLVQPLVSKRILPWYGGSPAVWTTCVLFFQTALFAGYAYAHLISRALSRRAQVLVHAAVLAAALIPTVLPGVDWAPQRAEYPVPRILAMLAVTVGLPFFALASTSPLTQAWFHRFFPRQSPWHLFATSNAGSLLALVSFPFLFEPAFPVRTLARGWKWGFVAFALTCGGILWRLAKAKDADAAGSKTDASRQDSDSVSRSSGPVAATQRPALWIGWSACGVILFMSVTNQLSLNIASAPFLWVIPLGTYLASFILTFSGPRFYPRRLFAFLLAAAFLVIYLVLSGDIDPDAMIVELGTMAKIVLSTAALFVCCTVCHGELYRARPEADRLTRYYLSISLGGVLGGILVGIVAPRVFLLYHELQVGLLACGTLFLLTLRRDPAGIVRRARLRWISGGAAGGLVAMTATSVWLTVWQLADTVETRRNFFGLHRVQDTGEGHNRVRSLHHGSTVHGVQLLEPELRRLPTYYYGPISGAGLVMRLVERPAGRRIGVVGLGAATLAAYGRKGDMFRFYEIDPDVVEIAQSRFTFLEDTEAEWTAELGDARLSLEREDAQGFDVLVLDAFSSDAVPVHLLTREAMDVYLRHLSRDGVIAIHVSNLYLDLAPIVYNLADAAGLRAVHVRNANEPGGATRAASWIVLTREASFLEGLMEASRPLQEEGLVRMLRGDPTRYRRLRTWTDDYSNLFQIMR